MAHRGRTRDPRLKRTPSQKLNLGISAVVWGTSGLCAMLALVLSNEFYMGSLGQFIGSSIVWGIATSIIALPMLFISRLLAAPVARRLDVMHTRALLEGLQHGGIAPPAPSGGLVAAWKRWRQRARRNRRIRRATTAWVAFLPALAAVLFAMLTARGFAFSEPVLRATVLTGLLAWAGGAAGLWMGRRVPEVARDELNALLEASGLGPELHSRVDIEVEAEIVKVRSASAAPVTVEPVTASTILAARHSEATGDDRFDEATRVSVDDHRQAPLQAWMTADVRAALATLVSGGGRMVAGMSQAEYDLTDEADVAAFVAGVAAAAQATHSLNARAVFGARDRVLDAANRATRPSEVQALVHGIRRHVPPDGVAETADWWANGVRGPARTFALDLAMTRAQRVGLALSIDADESEQGPVRGAALGDAIEQGAPEALTRFFAALHAGDAWRVVEAAAGCDAPLTGQAARDVAGAAWASDLAPPIKAAVIARIAPTVAGPRVEHLAESIVATRCGALTPESRAADLLAAQTAYPAWAEAGRTLAGRIAATRQGALAMVEPEGAVGGLAMAEPATAWRETTQLAGAGAASADAAVDRDAVVDAQEVESAVPVEAVARR